MDHKIKISGFSIVVEDVPDLITKINSLTGDSCVIQLLNAEGIAGEKHVLHATYHAIYAFKRGDNISSDLGLEICVRASAQRQISKALRILGLKKGFNNICAVLVDCNQQTVEKLENLLGQTNHEVLKADEEYLKNLYNISAEEINSSGGLTKAMMERTTLLVLET